MARTNSQPRDLGEKEIGLSDSVDPSIIEAPAELLAEHAVEYVEFLQLKESFESDSKAHKRLIRCRRS